MAKLGLSELALQEMQKAEFAERIRQAIAGADEARRKREVDQRALFTCRCPGFCYYHTSLCPHIGGH